MSGRLLTGETCVIIRVLKSGDVCVCVCVCVRVCVQERKCYVSLVISLPAATHIESLQQQCIIE